MTSARVQQQRQRPRALPWWEIIINIVNTRVFIVWLYTCRRRIGDNQRLPTVTTGNYMYRRQSVLNGAYNRLYSRVAISGNNLLSVHDSWRSVATVGYHRRQSRKIHHAAEVTGQNVHLSASIVNSEGRNSER